MTDMRSDKEVLEDFELQTKKGKEEKVRGMKGAELVVENALDERV